MTRAGDIEVENPRASVAESGHHAEVLAEWGLEQFADFVELIEDAVIASDRTGMIVVANSAAARQFGYSHAELLTKTVFDLTPPRRRAALESERRDFFESAAATTRGRHERHWGLCSDGREIPLEMTFSLFSTPKGPVRVSVLRDISEKVAATAERDELRSRLELSQARRMEAVGQLAGGIAHDFNNLLGVMINYADFAIQELGDRPAVRADVEEILAAANRAAELTQQLLIFSRRRNESRRPLNLNDVLREIEQLMRRAVGERIELVTDYADELSAVEAESGQLEQAVINLAINARDAMPGGGTLRIATANIELGADDVALRPGTLTPGPHVQLTVADTGTGMDSNTLANAFEPFFTTKGSEGTGLGLATVHGTVLSHGGAIHIDSHPDQGTTVEIILPASTEPAEPLSKDDRLASAPGRGERVLVIEDEQAVRQMVMRALASNGYDAVDCADAAGALELLADESEEFALILTDIVMPGVDGNEFARRARGLRPDLPLLFMSGYSELTASGPEDGERIDLLVKPFTVNALLGEVRRVLERSRR